MGGRVHITLNSKERTTAKWWMKLYCNVDVSKNMYTFSKYDFDYVNIKYLAG